MTQAQIDLPKEEIAKFCKKWKIHEFSFFGSVLTDDFRPDSDIAMSPSRRIQNARYSISYI